MFRTVVKSRVVARGRTAPAITVPAFSNDNRIGFGRGSPRRPTLGCHWTVSGETGRLQCRWESEDTGLTGDELGPRRRKRSTGPLFTVRLARPAKSVAGARC